MGPLTIASVLILGLIISIAAWPAGLYPPVAAMAIAAYAIADAEEPIAPRQDRTAIAGMLAAAHLDRLLEVYGLWKPGDTPR